MSDHMEWIFDDGGRAAAGFKGYAGDCVCRAIAIASGKPYGEIYAALSQGMGSQRLSKHHRRRRASARGGITVRRKWFKEYMTAAGFEWTPTMRIGQGCKVHLVAGELPSGRLVVQVAGHYTAVIDGIVRDTFDPQSRTYWYDAQGSGQITRISERCVYGYWTFKGVPQKL